MTKYALMKHGVILNSWLNCTLKLHTENWLSVNKACITCGQTVRNHSVYWSTLVWCETLSDLHRWQSWPHHASCFIRTSWCSWWSCRSCSQLRIGPTCQQLRMVMFQQLAVWQVWNTKLSYQILSDGLHHPSITLVVLPSSPPVHCHWNDWGDQFQNLTQSEWCCLQCCYQGLDCQG